jgi:hypothetical protein
MHLSDAGMHTFTNYMLKKAIRTKCQFVQSSELCQEIILRFKINYLISQKWLGKKNAEKTTKIISELINMRYIKL